MPESYSSKDRYFWLATLANAYACALVTIIVTLWGGAFGFPKDPDKGNDWGVPQVWYSLFFVATPFLTSLVAMFAVVPWSLCSSPHKQLMHHNLIFVVELALAGAIWGASTQAGFGQMLQTWPFALSAFTTLHLGTNIYFIMLRRAVR